MFSDWDFPPEALEPLTEVQTGDEGDNYFECSRCNKAYRSLKSLRRHRFHCGRTFDPRVRGFVQNYDETDDQAQFQCVYCNRAYRWKKGLKRHQQRCEVKISQEVSSIHNVEVSIIEESNDAIPEEPEIDIIGDDKEIVITHALKTKETESLREHNVDEVENHKSASEIMRNRDATIGRFQCILCGKRYGWLKNLRRHQRICRKKVNKHRWKECKVMLEPLSLRSSKHVSEQNFKCPNCSKEYKWLRDLRQHQTICIKKPQNFWNVSEANNSSKNQLTLNEHQGHSTENSNNSNVDPCHKCAFCGKEYKWRRSLRRHYPKCTERGDSQTVSLIILNGISS